MPMFSKDFFVSDSDVVSNVAKVVSCINDNASQNRCDGNDPTFSSNIRNKVRIVQQTINRMIILISTRYGNEW